MRMSNLITRTTELAMKITTDYVREGDTIVDATCGTGRDTEVLAKAVGNKGKVFAFDIQEAAIELTRARLKEAGCGNVQLIQASFSEMCSYVPENSASAVVFNLGYLPGGDHSITTTSEETIAGLNAALKSVRTEGIITVVMYDGHEQGREEKKQVLKWASDLDSGAYHADYVSMINQGNHPPEILWITRKR